MCDPLDHSRHTCSFLSILFRPDTCSLIPFATAASGLRSLLLWTGSFWNGVLLSYSRNSIDMFGPSLLLPLQKLSTLLRPWLTPCDKPFSTILLCL
uniref:Uncharacterized protein n=1 Tax=Faecalibaculum rodentium TaxID=1702221 RepID=A0A140DT91_9FIRM|nr:hypothetical protein AALO17_07340 [Faecalibaculum rodentium]